MTIKSDKTNQSFDLHCCKKQNLMLYWSSNSKAELLTIECKSCKLSATEATTKSYYEWTELCCAERFERSAMYCDQNSIAPSKERFTAKQLRSVNDSDTFVVSVLDKKD